jgi:predicted RNA binding protein YcfA (HicA-like mRNA interferase family)
MGDWSLSELPSVSGAQTVKALEKAGWVLARSKGDHAILTKTGMLANVCIPQHRELKRPTLKNILQAADLTAAEFKQLL